MNKKTLLSIVVVALIVVACGGGAKEETSQTDEVSLGEVQINAHPTSLEGKTVVLRWNSKPNGDKFLTRIGELLTEQVKNVKVIKLWEIDPSTAEVSTSIEDSAQVAEKVAAQQPDLVIASQADCGACTKWLIVDQLSVEQKGIPTVTIATSAYEKKAREAAAAQGVTDFSLLIVEHPIAGHDAAGIVAKVDGVFSEILKAATEWQPAK